MTALPGGGGKGPGPHHPQQQSRTRQSMSVGLDAVASTATTSTSTTTDERSQAREQQNETFRIIKEMSDILNTGLNTQSLACVIRLCGDGVNPVALAHFIKDWKHQQQIQQPKS